MLCLLQLPSEETISLSGGFFYARCSREQSQRGNCSARSGGRTVLYRKGKPAFAIVPAEDAEYMQKLEDELDNPLADEALAEASEDVPTEILFQRYGCVLK